jgi:hypothetical protein
VATLEQLLDAHQLAHAHPSGSSADIIAGQILPFAPEPERLEENAGGGVREEQLPIPDVAGEHGVRGMPYLLPDLERGDPRPSRARREARA